MKRWCVYKSGLVRSFIIRAFCWIEGAFCSSQTSFVSKSEPKSDLKIQFIGVGENNIINRGTDSNTLKQLTSVFKLNVGYGREFK